MRPGQKFLSGVAQGGAMCFGMLGVCALLAGLEGLTRAGAPWGEGVGLSAFGAAALLHGALVQMQVECPRLRAVVVARLPFSAGGALLLGGLAWGALEFLSTPHPGECGLPVVAALSFCLLSGVSGAVEVASWVSWWQGRAGGA